MQDFLNWSDPNAVPDSIQKGEPRRREQDTDKGQHLLVTQRKQRLPISLGV